MISTFGLAAHQRERDYTEREDAERGDAENNHA